MSWVIISISSPMRNITSPPVSETMISTGETVPDINQ